jgi:hypothetical protein
MLEETALALIRTSADPVVEAGAGRPQRVKGEPYWQPLSCAQGILMTVGRLDEAGRAYERAADLARTLGAMENRAGSSAKRGARRGPGRRARGARSCVARVRAGREGGNGFRPPHDLSAARASAPAPPQRKRSPWWSARVAASSPSGRTSRWHGGCSGSRGMGTRAAVEQALDRATALIAESGGAEVAAGRAPHARRAGAPAA